jgi:hypothetical protein
VCSVIYFENHIYLFITLTPNLLLLLLHPTLSLFIQTISSLGAFIYVYLYLKITSAVVLEQVSEVKWNDESDGATNDVFATSLVDNIALLEDNTEVCVHIYLSTLTAST